MPASSSDALVTTDWLADNLDNPGVVVLDGTYHLPTAKRDAAAEYAEKHIAGAVRGEGLGIGDFERSPGGRLRCLRTAIGGADLVDVPGLRAR
jgi:hypothetical protein